MSQVTQAFRQAISAVEQKPTKTILYVLLEMPSVNTYIGPLPAVRLPKAMEQLAAAS